MITLDKELGVDHLSTPLLHTADDKNRHNYRIG